MNLDNTITSCTPRNGNCNIKTTLIAHDDLIGHPHHDQLGYDLHSDSKHGNSQPRRKDNQRQHQHHHDKYALNTPRLKRERRTMREHSTPRTSRFMECAVASIVVILPLTLTAVSYGLTRHFLSGKLEYRAG